MAALGGSDHELFEVGVRQKHAVRERQQRADETELRWRPTFMDLVRTVARSTAVAVWVLAPPVATYALLLRDKRLTVADPVTAAAIAAIALTVTWAGSQIVKLLEHLSAERKGLAASWLAERTNHWFLEITRLLAEHGVVVVDNLPLQGPIDRAARDAAVVKLIDANRAQWGRQGVLLPVRQLPPADSAQLSAVP
jgi:hypothetical protein